MNRWTNHAAAAAAAKATPGPASAPVAPRVHCQWSNWFGRTAVPRLEAPYDVVMLLYIFMSSYRCVQYICVRVCVFTRS